MTKQQLQDALDALGALQDQILTIKNTVDMPEDAQYLLGEAAVASGPIGQAIQVVMDELEQ